MTCAFPDTTFMVKWAISSKNESTNRHELLPLTHTDLCSNKAHVPSSLDREFAVRWAHPAQWTDSLRLCVCSGVTLYELVENVSGSSGGIPFAACKLWRLVDLTCRPLNLNMQIRWSNLVPRIHILWKPEINGSIGLIIFMKINVMSRTMKTAFHVSAHRTGVPRYFNFRCKPADCKKFIISLRLICLACATGQSEMRLSVQDPPASKQA